MYQLVMPLRIIFFLLDIFLKLHHATKKKKKYESIEVQLKIFIFDLILYFINCISALFFLQFINKYSAMRLNGEFAKIDPRNYH